MSSKKPGGGLNVISRKKNNAKKSTIPEAVSSKLTLMMVEENQDSRNHEIFLDKNLQTCKITGTDNSDSDAVDEMTHGDGALDIYGRIASKKNLIEESKSHTKRNSDLNRTDLKVNQTILTTNEMIFTDRDEIKKPEPTRISKMKNVQHNQELKESSNSEITQSPKDSKSKSTADTKEVDVPCKFQLNFPAGSLDGSQGFNRSLASPKGSQKRSSKSLTPQISDMDTERQLHQKQDRKPLKQRIIQNLKFFNDHKKSMIIFNASELTKDEPARKKVLVSSHMKPIIMFLIAILAFFSIVMSSIKKLNTLKSQSLVLKKQIDFEFDMNNQTLPVHYFTELTQYQITNRMGCLIDDDPLACINYCDQIANITSQTDIQRWACYESKRVPTQLYGRSKCEKTNPNYLTTLTTKTAFLNCLVLNRQSITLKEACVLQNDNNQTIYNCWGGCTKSSTGDVTCNQVQGIVPDYPFCLLQQSVLNTNSQETMDCFTKDAKLTVNKTMCDDAYKIQTFNELDFFATDQRAQQQEQVQNTSEPLMIDEYPDCSINFTNVTDQIKDSSISCMMTQQQSDRQKCYTDYLPKNSELCVVLNGTNFRGYFDCLNTMFDRPPKYADGCWIQQFYSGAQSQTLVIENPVENMVDCYERSNVPLLGQKCIYELEAYQLTQYLLVGNKPEEAQKQKPIPPPDTGNDMNAPDPNAEEDNEDNGDSTANLTEECCECECSANLNGPGLGGNSIGGQAPGQMGGAMSGGLILGGSGQSMNQIGGQQETAGQLGGQTGNQVGQQGQGGQISQGGGQQPGVQTKGGATQQQQSQGGNNKPQQSSQNQGGQNSGQSQPQQSQSSSSNGEGQQQQPSGNQQPSRGEPPSGGGAQGGGGGKGGGGRQLQPVKVENTLQKALQCFQNQKISIDYIQCQLNQNTYFQFSPFIVPTNVTFVNKTKDNSAQYCQQKYKQQVTAYSYDAKKTPPVEYMQNIYQDECQQVVRQDGQLQSCLKVSPLGSQIDASITNSTLQVQNLQRLQIQNCNHLFNQPNQQFDLKACELANGQLNGINDCFQGIHQNPQYFQFPNLNKYYCLRWKFNVQMPKSLSDCLGSKITITYSEKCMSDMYIKYQYELSEDQQTYRKKNSVAVIPLTKDYYQYKNNFNTTQILNFLCNNNVKLNFVTSPYQDQRQEGFTRVLYDAEKQTYDMDCQILTYDNGTQQNVIVHNMFKLTPNKTIIPDSYQNYYSNNENKKIFVSNDAELKQIPMKIHRTDTNQQMWKMSYTTNMNYLSIQSETMIHYGQNTPNIANYKNYTAFVGSADATKIFQLAPWNIGQRGIAPINVNAHTERHIQKGKKVTKMMFGYPIAFNNTEDKVMLLDSINSVIESSSSLPDKNSVNIYLRMNFVENVYTFTYFNIMDLLSQLGGIGATVQLGVGAIGFIFIVQYIAQLTGVVHRRKKEKYRMLKVNQLAENIDKVQEKIDSILIDAAQQCLPPDDLRKLSEDLENVKKIPDMPQYTYTEQIAKYKMLKHLFNNYVSKNYVHDHIYTQENKLKMNFYEQMIKKEDYTKISEDIHERSSFYGKYIIYTKNKLTKEMVRDIRECGAQDEKENERLQKILYSIQQVDGDKFSDMEHLNNALIDINDQTIVKTRLMSQIVSRNDVIMLENDDLSFKMDAMINNNQILQNQIQAIQDKDKIRDLNEERIFGYIQSILRGQMLKNNHRLATQPKN